MFGDIGIDEKTVEAVLNIRKDFRHLTQRRLWTGTSLSTTSISNNIRLFPQYRLTYHEKTFVIHNDENKQDRDWWFTANTQEALYTFHVPEGSIVTSLSLWINGREEKSRLSTARKADSAYTTVVGVERRDPAVVHWQEGNRITVNVFPCTKEEDRTFKIGFTAPMKIENGKMWLENIWFEGPEFSTAREVTQIFVDGESPMPIDLPGNFEKNAAGDYVYQGDYIPYWKIAFDPLPLSKNKFAFGGYEYSLKDLAFVQKDLKISEVYLDVTNEWTREEYNEALSRLDGMNVYAWVPAKVKITAENRGKVWEEVSINCFSAPFLYDITDPAHTAIITKTGPRSPVLEDMKGSLYADKMGKYIVETSAKVHVINIGQETSPLWRSLHELRLVDYSKSSLSAALDEVKSGKFTVFPEDSMTVALIDCKLGIVKKKVADTTLKSSAPDHLLRIFAYNDVLRKIGKRYFEKEKYEDELFRETEEGYVVTPVSSMIVLESAQDYERMGIDENKNTVGNASVMGGGAVPEPHEWLLIITVAAFILYQLYTRFKTKFGRA
jgi:XrtN system VIT domain protein